MFFVAENCEKTISRRNMDLKKLTESNITSAVKLRNNMISWNEVDELLLREFEKNKVNKNPHHIGYKIELVNKLYNCNLNMDKKLVAEEIQKLKLDLLFAEKDASPEDIVEKIASIQPLPYGRSVGPVFASKYCHFHYPEIFPIYDKYSRFALSDLLGKKKGEYENKYPLFKNDLDGLMENLSWKTSYKELDVYLWLYGQWIEYKKYRNDEVKLKINFSLLKRNFIRDNIELFQKLDPD